MEYRIGNVKLDSRLILAPMAGVNCAAFRLLCKEAGAGLVSTPMILINDLVKEPERIINQTCFLREEKPISVQLVGSDSALAEEATKIIDEYADIIDVNLGCTESDILGLKSGAFFSKHPEQIKKIVAPIISNTNKPVTAKIRIGWDDETKNTLESIKILQNLGVAAIAIHGRTVKQGYSGKADWEEILKAKEIATVPIIGNGDLFMPGTAKTCMERSKCDFLMIGRASMGNPLIFTRTKALLETGKNMPETTEEEQKASFLKFMNYYSRYEHNRSFTELRQQALWFTKDLHSANEMKHIILRAQTPEDIKKAYTAKISAPEHRPWQRPGFHEREDRGYSPRGFKPYERRERPSFERSERPERRSFDGSERTERRPFERPERRSFDRSERPERKEYAPREFRSHERPAYKSFDRPERKTFDRQERTEHRSFDRPENTERRSFERPERTERKPFERRSFDRSERGGFVPREYRFQERPAYRSSDRPERTEHRSFVRPEQRERKSFDRPERTERRSFDRSERPERRPFIRPGQFERRPFERRSFDKPEQRSFDRPRSDHRRPDDRADRGERPIERSHSFRRPTHSPHEVRDSRGRERARHARSGRRDVGGRIRKSGQGGKQLWFKPRKG